MESDEQILSSSFSSSSSSSNSSFSITRTRTTRKILAAALPRRAATMSRSFHSLRKFSRRVVARASRPP